MSSISRKPRLTQSQATFAFFDLYRTEPASMKPLPGERDQNFLVELPDGQRFVLKVCNPDEPRDFVAAQVDALNHLKSFDFVPSLLLTQQSKPLATVSIDANDYVIRAVGYLPGTPLAQIKRPSASLLSDLGRKLARVDLVLMEMDAPILNRNFDWNLLDGIQVINDYAALIPDDATKSLVMRLAERIEQSLSGSEGVLRQTVIHNDANDYNVIVSDDRDECGERYVTGLIDFGDMAKSYLVGELAIALAYITCRRPDPLNAACEVVAAYHDILPLENSELAKLLDLLLLRLCVSVCMHARQQSERPDDEYLSISQEPIRRTLPVLGEIHPDYAEARLRAACELDPWPKSKRISQAVVAQRDSLFPIMGTRLHDGNCAFIDLSVASENAQPFVQSTSESAADARTSPIKTDKEFSIGRYGEPRLIYSDSAFQTSSEHVIAAATAERRTIHLGVDVFAPAGTSVFAPTSGVVHLSEFRDQDQDYGGVLVLRHTSADAGVYFSLYGHLSHKSIARKSVGDIVAAGELLGNLGTSKENGGWAPHLHLQLISNFVGLADDFPGVAAASEERTWTSLSPNPVDLLCVDAGIREQFCTASQNDVQEKRQRHVSSSLSIAYRNPVHIVRGQAQYLFDAKGRRYLDAYNNVPHVGHCHPRVIAAAHQQMTTLNTNTRYLHSTVNEYARRLASTLPDRLDTCFFVNSASEANELAIRLARSATGRRGVVVQEAAYHGNTTTLIDISPYKHDGPGGKGTPDWVHKVALPDRFRGQHRGQNAGRLYGEEAAALIQHAAQQANAPAAFIAETLPSVGGQIVPPREYYPIVYEAIRRVGGVAIADEVQTGFGRMGTNFWAFEDYSISPDIVVMGKPIGNGYPLAAVVTTREISDSFDNGMEYFSTFGGSTVSCAVGLAVLDVLEEEDLQRHAWRIGNILQARFSELASEFPLIGDVRGGGLFWGLELVRDLESLEPADVEASLVSNRLRDKGILIGTDGPFHNVLKIRPPMPFDENDAEHLVMALRETFQTEF